MTCEEARNNFSDHLDGVLDDHVEDRLGRHLADCPDCRRALQAYIEPLESLAGAAPEPPPDLEDRIRRRLEDEGCLGSTGGRLRWLVPMAAGLAVFLLGYFLGHGPVRPDAGTRQSGWDALRAPASCSVDWSRWARLDPSALRDPPAPPEEARSLEAWHRRVELPGRLVSHGPFQAEVERAIHTEQALCLPLTDPFGEVLLLTVAPVPADGSPSEESFQVEPDPGRILYVRVLWARGGLLWSLEGRAPAGDLLELARELSSGATVRGCNI